MVSLYIHFADQTAESLGIVARNVYSILQLPGLFSNTRARNVQTFGDPLHPRDFAQIHGCVVFVYLHSHGHRSGICGRLQIIVTLVVSDVL